MSASVGKPSIYWIIFVMFIFITCYSLSCFGDEDVQSLLAKAFELKDNNKDEEAIAMFQRILQKEPHNTVAISNIGHLHRKKGRFKEALTFYKKAVDIAPGEASFRIFLGDLYKENGEIEKALVEYERAVQLEPRSLWALRELGYAYKDTGRLDESLEIFKKMLEIAPNDATIYQALGHVYRDKKSLKESELHYRTAISLSPEQFENYVFLGDLLKEKGSMDEALILYQKAVKMNPKSSWARVSLGDCYIRLGEQEKGFDEYLKAVEVEPSSALAHTAICDYYRSKGRLKEAKLACRKAVELSPNDSELHLKLAYIHMDLYEMEDAKREFMLAVDKAPNRWETHYGLSQFFIKTGKKEKAEETLKKALNTAPNNPANLAAIGYAYKDLGNYKMTETLFEKTSVITPEFYDTYIGMAYFLKDRGYFYTAERNFFKSISLNPKRAEAYEGLTLLYEQDGYRVNRYIGIGGRFEYSEDLIPIDSYITDAKLLFFSKNSDFQSQLRKSKNRTLLSQITLRYPRIPRLKIVWENRESIDAYEDRLVGFKDICSRGVNLNLEKTYSLPFLRDLTISTDYKRTEFNGINSAMPNRKQDEYYISFLVSPEGGKTKFLTRFNYTGAEFYNLDLKTIQRILYLEFCHSVPSLKANFTGGCNWEKVVFSPGKPQLIRNTFILDMYKKVLPKLSGNVRAELLLAKNSDATRIPDIIDVKTLDLSFKTEYQPIKDLNIISKLESSFGYNFHKFDNYTLGLEILNTFKVKLPCRAKGMWLFLSNHIRFGTGCKITSYYNLDKSIKTFYINIFNIF